MGNTSNSNRKWKRNNNTNRTYSRDGSRASGKVELNRHNLDNIEVKFRYSIRVTNEGEIAGYAKEITDYVPEGLRFVAEDNPGWTE